MRHSGRWLSLLLAVALLSGCALQPVVPSTEPAPVSLTVALDGTSLTFDSTAASTPMAALAVTQVSRGLFAMEGSKVTYALCEEYTVTDDGLWYRFTIRPDAKWSDGTSLTARDFVRGITQAVQPGSQAGHLEFALENLAGAREIHEGKSAELGVRAVNDRTLEIQLRQACANFPQLLTFPLFHPVATQEKYSGAFYPSADQEESSWEERRILVANPYFYDAPKVALDQLVLRLTDSPGERLSGFGSGSFQLALQLNEEIVRQVAYDEKLQYIQALDSLCLVLEDGSVFSSWEIRQALLLALDRETLCASLVTGERPLSALVPTGIGNPATGIDFREEGGRLCKEDVVLAQKLLADEGYAQGKNFPIVTYYHGDSRRSTEIASQIQLLWQQNLGIQVALVPLSQRESRPTPTGPIITEWQFAYDYGDPLRYLSLFAGDSVQPTGFISQDYNELLTEGAAEPDLGRQLERYHQAEKLLCESGWIQPICRWGVPVLVQNSVTGFTGQPDGVLDFTYARIIK